MMNATSDLFRRLSFFCLLWTVLIAALQSAPAGATNITPHRFADYPADQIYRLVDRIEIGNVALHNCSDCEPIAIPDYVIEGMIRLIELQPSELSNTDYFHPSYGEVSVRDSPLRENELAVIVDYHLNYSHIFSFQRKDHLIEMTIDNSYPVSNGIGGMANRRRSGGTPGGVHFLYYKQNTTATENEIVFSKDWSLVGKVVTPTIDDYWWESAMISARRLRLAGLEKSNENSVERNILLHGTPEEGYLGMHKSAGCIRFSNRSIVAISEQLKHGALVNIVGDTRDILNDGTAVYANNRAKRQ